MYAGKPIIGIVGGIGSGKSFVADLFGELGCVVIHSDEQVRAAYHDKAVKATLRRWWGDEVFRPDGEVDRAAVAAKVFVSDGERRRLEQLLHPRVAETRDQIMKATADDPKVPAFVWDTPLLVETSLHRQCDAVIFVEAPPELRASRVRAGRGWDREELSRRENLQAPLDKKRQIADHVIGNTADAGDVRKQVRTVLSRILAGAGSAPEGRGG